LTGIDWAIVVFTLLMAVWGYQQGLIVGALSLIGFVAGAFIGSRIGPALLPDGSESPYAPATALAGALLFGGLAAISLEGAGHRLRARLVRQDAAEVADGAGGALLLAVIGLGLAWLFGAVALNAPGAKELRKEVQRSAILRGLNDAFPPSGFLLNTLNRIDPGVTVTGPNPGVGPPNSRIARDPDVDRAGDSVVHVLGTACGLGVSGSGWIASPGLVVTNAHVIAGQDDTTVTERDGAEHDATPVHYDTSNDLALLRVSGLGDAPLRLVSEPQSGTSGAVLGYPEDGPFTVSPARLGTTGTVISEDSYGRGPIRRLMTALRAEVRSGDSGGPMVDAKGRVLTTVFAATTSGRQGGYGVPNEVVADALSDSRGEVGTGPCTH
jgi:Trypsin-like peptidase domain/Colicin V production protein